MEDQPTRPPIEVGWMLQNRFNEPERQALDAARERVMAQLQQVFDRFAWVSSVIRRGEPTPRAMEEPVELLDEGVHQRDARHLDFVFVITGADLRTYTKPFAFATPSRAVGVAVISISRLTSDAPEERGEASDAIDVIARRVTALAMHCLADMLGVPHADDPSLHTCQPERAEDLDKMERFSDTDRKKMDHELGEVADPRVEEEEGTRRSLVRFYLRSLVVGRDEIAAAIWRAAPWQFPFRLGRLSTAALSSLLVLMLTEETWRVGTGQPGWLVAILSIGTILATSVYILRRQNLLLSRGGNRLTEQNVVTQTAITIVVVLGMLATYLMLLAIAALVAAVIFTPTVADRWSGGMTWREYLVLGGFIATIGVAIGALGASFEGQAYFRHLTYVDEET